MTKHSHPSAKNSLSKDFGKVKFTLIGLVAGITLGFLLQTIWQAPMVWMMISSVLGVLLGAIADQLSQRILKTSILQPNPKRRRNRPRTDGRKKRPDV